MTHFASLCEMETTLLGLDPTSCSEASEKGTTGSWGLGVHLGAAGQEPSPTSASLQEGNSLACGRHLLLLLPGQNSHACAGRATQGSAFTKDGAGWWQALLYSGSHLLLQALAPDRWRTARAVAVFLSGGQAASCARADNVSRVRPAHSPSTQPGWDTAVPPPMHELEPCFRISSSTLRFAIKIKPFHL